MTKCVLLEQTSHTKRIYEQINNVKNTPVSCKTAAEKKRKKIFFQFLLYLIELSIIIFPNFSCYQQTIS